MAATQSLDDIEMPRNFSWVIDDLLCACAYPGRSEHLRYLRNQGVTCIVTLTAEHDLPAEDIQDFEVVLLKMVDFTPPTMEQVLRFVEVMEQAEDCKQSVAVHCAAGRGRTGTVISCYLVKKLGLTAHQAIQLLRRLRPGSVETEAQADMVSKYESLLKQLRPEGQSATACQGFKQYQAFLDELHSQSTETQFSRLQICRSLEDLSLNADQCESSRDQFTSESKETQSCTLQLGGNCEDLLDGGDCQTAEEQRSISQDAS
ncbi:dual specificity protein phosphatase 23-like [Littorina saxatilis]|uniref:Dual specificity protein phosphatase 23 n=1 Tax=Littorina saxatilis TaxID=31220 RepID=A0AAN9G941_9CAEN